MALTRPRYSQIPDSDYKNSCRIVTTTDVTLTGSAPLTYDGVTLVQYDRVLVAGQTDKTQNGIYSVSTLGSGSNGTWVRSKDANANDRLTAGMNTFVEEGTYSGQFWHLLTPGPIVLGVTELVFGQISGNAAGISSQVQYNSAGSIAGAANLRYDSATGNVVIGGGTVSTSNVTGALVVNGGIGVTGEIWAQSNIYSVGSRVLTQADLETVTFLANYISKDPSNVAVPVVGTGTIYGTHNFGNLEAISTFGDYDTVAQSGYYSVNDASGAPGFVVYVGFTGISDFNRAVYNINYTQNSGHTITIDLYNYNTDAWDAFAQYSGAGSWQTFALSVIDADPYIDVAGNVTTRIYHVSSGNTAHRTWIDYVALEKSITGGSGPRGATGPTGPSGTYSGGYISGAIITGGNIFTSGNIVSNSGNISISTTTGAIVITGNGGIGVGGNIFAGENITANAFYTINGLFWEGNGLAFSSGLEVSEINTANTLSNISTQVTSLRFDKDTGFTVTELNPGNVKISLGSSFKTWHVPGQADLVAVAEDEVTFFGNGIDITTNPTFPKSITFIANNSILEANIGAFYNYANANIGTLYLGNISTQANLGAFQVFSNANAASQQTDINNINANLGAYQIYANANIGTLYLGNISTQANLGAFQTYANTTIGGILTEISSLYVYIDANAGIQSANIASINANIGAFQAYANSKIGTNNNSNLVVTSTTESVSAITGAVVVAGGVGVGGNLYVAGNIYASNLVSINSTTLTVQDPLLYLNASDPFPYNYDIGFYSHFVSDHYQHTGIARDYSNGIWGFFSNLRAEPGTTIEWSNVEIIYDTVRVGDLVASNTTPSTSTTTGALRVAGGAGIEGELYINNTGDVSANIGSIYNQLNTLDANVGSYQTYANIYLGSAVTFTVTDSGSSEYVINNENNPALYLVRGQKYNFSVDATGHPFWIKTAPSIGVGDQYNTGVANNGEDNGIVAFEVPLTAPDVLYYVSQFDAAMTNELRIVNFSTLDANIGSLYLGNVSTQANLGAYQTYANTRIQTLDANIGSLYLGNVSTNANLGAFQTYANARIATLDANIGTLYLGNIGTQANLGAFQTYANTTFTTYSNANVAAYLPIYTGNISAGNIEVTSKVAAGTVYTTDGIYWSGNGNPYSTGGGGGGITYTAATTPPVGPAIGDQWYDTAEGILYEYMDDGDTDQWVDIISPTFSGASPVAFNSNVTVTGNIFIGDGIYWSANGDPYASGGGGSFSGEDTVLRANVGAYQIYANANIGTLFLGNISTQANLGAYQTWANSRIETLDANIGTLFLGNISTQANLGAYQTWANSRIETLDANLGTLFLGNISTQANLGTLFLGNISTQANLGAYQTWANSNFGTSTYSNTNVAAYLTQGATIGSGTTTGNLVANANTTSTSTTTGALVVRGGAGIGGALNVGTTGTFAGLLQTTSSSAATSTSSGALYVAGGTGIVGNLHVGGNVIIASATNSNVVVVSTTTSTSITTGALVVRGGVGVAGNAYISGNVILGSSTTSNVVVAATTTSTSTTTGALVVRGGAGIAGVAIVGGNIVAAATTTSTSTTTGALVVAGGVGIAGVAIVGGNIVAAATTTSTSSTTGALVVAGGVGIAGRLNVAGNIVAASGTASTNTTSGALVVTGGIGVSGNINTGANIFATSGNVTTSRVFTTNGVYWSGNGALYGSQFDFTSSSTAPSSPTVGDFWYYTTDQILFQYINDGTTNYWVDVQTAPLSANVSQEIFVGNTTIGGNVTIAANTTVGGNLTILSSIVENDYAVIDILGGSSTVTLSPLNGTMQRWTLVASRSAQFENFFNGCSMTLMIVATSYSISSWTGVSWIGGSAPTLSNSTTTVLEFWKSGGTLYGGLVGST